MELVTSKQLRVSAVPTLSMPMLLGGAAHPRYFPFNAPTAKHFYFARNGVWFAAKLFQLENREVLVPAYHHGVEVEALLDAGARVRFYRVDRNARVDLDDLARKIGSTTRAIYLIHYLGFPGPIEEIRKLADANGLVLIEDCALSLFSSLKGIPLGSFGDASVFCHYKTLPVPNGGTLLMNDLKSMATGALQSPPLVATFQHAMSSWLQHLELNAGPSGARVRALIRRWGSAPRSVARQSSVPTGSQHFQRRNVRLSMSDIALRIAAKQNPERIVSLRRRNYFYLLAHLGDLGEPLFSELGSGVCPLFFPLRVENKIELKNRLLEDGIETIDFWRNFHPACDPSQFDEVKELRQSVLEIPCHQDLDVESLAGIVEAVRNWFPARCSSSMHLAAG